MSNVPNAEVQESEADARAIPIFEAIAVLNLDTSDPAEKLERFYEVCDWIEDQHDGGSRGFRFIDGFSWPTSELRAMRGIEFPAWEPYLSWLLPNTTEMRLHLKVPALSEAQAMSRFMGIVDTISALIGQGGKRYGLLNIEPQGEITRGKDQTIPKNLEDLFFRFADAWFDPNDDGKFDEENVRSSMQVEIYHGLLPSTDDKIEAVTSLEVMVKHLPDVVGNPLLWNWVLIATHHALQGFMVQALVTSNQARVGLIDPKTNRYKLDDFLTLFKKIRSDRWMQFRMNSVTYKTGVKTIDNIKRLNRLRNSFIHYEPRLTIIHEVRSYPPLIRDATSIISFLVYSSNNIDWFADETPLKRRADIAIESVNSLLDAIEREYESREAMLRKKSPSHQ